MKREREREIRYQRERERADIREIGERDQRERDHRERERSEKEREIREKESEQCLPILILSSAVRKSVAWVVVIWSSVLPMCNNE